MIIIDSREKNVKEFFSASGTPYEEDTLDSGDYTNQNRDFFVERKKSFDMIQSLVTGHLIVQLNKMREDNPDTPLYLVFEGDYDALIESQTNHGYKQWLKTFPYKIAHIYGIQFVKVYDTLELIEFLKILDQYAKGIKDSERMFEGIHMTNERDERIRALLAVPQLGQEKAKLLLNKYDSIQEIVSACLNKPKEVMELEGIGKSSVQKILDMFIGKEAFIKQQRGKDKKDIIATKKRIAKERETYEKKMKKNV